MKTRLAMFGVDAGDLAFIRRHAALLPFFRRLLDEGRAREIETTSELLTGSVWPTFYTGLLPGRHGIYHHLQWDSQRMSLRRVSPEWLDAEPFWYELDRRGFRVAVADVPMRFPPKLERGFEVVNWGSHDQLGPFAASDAALGRELRRRFGPHPMGAEIPVNKTAGELRRIRDAVVRGAARKGEVLGWLLERQPWDFFLGVFGETHRGGHILWPEKRPAAALLPPDALLDVYQAVDRALAEVAGALDLSTTTIVVFSLHGMEANRSQAHLVPKIMDRLLPALGGRGKAVTGPPSNRRGLIRTLRERVPARLQNALARAVPVWARDWVVTRQVCAGYDWQRTPVFPILADYNGYLRLNIRGREKEGILEPGSVETRELIERLQQEWRAIRTPSGEPIAAAIDPVETVYPGPRADRLPDLIVRWAPEKPVNEAASPTVGTVRSSLDTGRGGNHRHRGFLAVLGQEPRIDLARIQHIADFAQFVRDWYSTTVTGG